MRLTSFPGTVLCQPWLLVIATLSLVSIEATAQQPVCPPPTADTLYYAACAPEGQLRVSRLLAEFSVDHLFKPKMFPFRRHPFDLLRLVDPGWAVPDEHPLVEYAHSLDPILFTRFDTSSGAVEWEVEEAERRFSTTVEIGDARYEVGWILPSHLAGGYWRTPAALQIALWQNQRPSIRIKTPSGVTVESEISCVAISYDDLRVVTTDPETPDLILGLGRCD